MELKMMSTWFENISNSLQLVTKVFRLNFNTKQPEFVCSCTNEAE